MNLFLWINVSVLNYSLAFIETKPKVTYIKDNKETTSKLDYEICDKYDYIIKEDYKYSIITDFDDGTECNKLKNSLIGTINSIGILLGNFLFHMISGKFGYKNILFIFHLGHAVFLLVSIFWDNYYFFQVINCFVMFFTKCILNFHPSACYFLFKFIFACLFRRRAGIFSIKTTSAKVCLA